MTHYVDYDALKKRLDSMLEHALKTENMHIAETIQFFIDLINLYKKPLDKIK